MTEENRGKNISIIIPAKNESGAIGELVTDLLVEHFPDVMSVDFTARLEDNLDEIAEGKPWLPVMDEFYGTFSTRLKKADKAIEKVDVASKEPELVGRNCPESGHPLVYRENRKVPGVTEPAMRK